ncbi:MAG TPA: c-type cytochrome domain-containing protein [Methylomirabilota bacterium]|nr:c-type cytochrome domain-containing protein [Methylomirabilota bacterium]
MRLLSLTLAISVASALAALAQEKITFQDHVLPLVEANCAKCHNSDKKKGDLDLTSYSAALAGGAAGKVLVAGDADASKLWKAINHTEDPSMPPNRGKMTDKELAVFQKWIAGGLLETLSSKAIGGKPTVDLAIGAGAIGKPEGPPPMPGDMLMEPVASLKRSTAVTGLAASPWAPIVAVAGQKQVVLYHSGTLDLLGVLPFRDDQATYQPDDVKFSRNGKLLVVGGGHAARAGRVMVFEITTGERIISVGAGQEFDSALGSDISPDQSRIALGGPSRILKVFSTKDGSLLFKMKKHTDWVTAVAFSPNGEWLASADRNGGITIWDADNGLEIHTLAGHKAGVTALSWRPDSKLLASVSEDGSAKIWEMNDGKQVKTWNPHPGGALSISYTHDGRMVTCGRDNQVVAWSADGAKLKSFGLTNELPVRATFSHDGERVVASDWTGRVTVWETKTGRRTGELSANPPPITEQVATVQQRLTELQSGHAPVSPAKAAAESALKDALSDLAKASNTVEKARAALAPKEAEDAKLRAEVIAKRTPELEARRAVSRAAREAGRAALANALAAWEAKTAQVAKLNGKGAEDKVIDPAEELAALKTRLAKLKAAQVYASAYYAKESIAARKREQEKLLASGTKADKAAAEKLAKLIAKEEKDLQKLAGEYEKLKSAAAESASKQQARL